MNILICSKHLPSINAGLDQFGVAAPQEKSFEELQVLY